MATNKNGDVKNNCVICLEPLLGANVDDDDDKNDKMCDMGVSNCGHPAHYSCFQQWANFQEVSGDDKKERRLPCPTCQRDIQSFVKVYLRVENNNKETLYDTEDDEEEEFCDANENIAPSNNSTSNGSAVLSSGGSTCTDPPGRTPAGRKQSSASPTTICNVAIGNALSSSNNIANKKTKNQNNSKAVHKKTQWYKKKWMAKQDEVKILKLEAQHRKKCHNKDMISLERYQLMTFRLENELERTNLTSRICRNAVGVAAFAVGWLLNRKLMSCSG